MVNCTYYSPRICTEKEKDIGVQLRSGNFVKLIRVKTQKKIVFLGLYLFIKYNFPNVDSKCFKIMPILKELSLCGNFQN